MRWISLVSVCGLMITGCGDSGPIRIQTAPVRGTATYEGKPLEGYRVFFYAMGHPAQEPSTGRVAADGTFEMSVRQPGDGAIVGTNQVWVKYDPDLGEQDPDKGGWQPLPPPKVKVPDKYQSAETSGIVVEVPPEGLTEFKLELQ